MEDILQLEPVVTETSFVTDTTSDTNFVHANTEVITFNDLKGKCTIPVFCKDNESTISHPEFIEAVVYAAQNCFRQESFLKPAIRISHAIKGRVPSAIGLPVDQLTEDQKTIYYERMAFAIELPSVKETIGGNELNLTLGGVKAYNFDNLNGKKTEEHFKVFIGFKNKVCCNLCIWTDGFRSEIRARTVSEIVQEAYSLFSAYKPELQLRSMAGFGEHFLSEHQFAQLIGRSRLYNFLPSKLKKEIQNATPLLDAQVSIVARDYYSDKSFCRNSDGSIDLWRLYNLFTNGIKTSYVDTFLDRNVGATNFIRDLQNALKQGSEHWFLS